MDLPPAVLRLFQVLFSLLIGWSLFLSATAVYDAAVEAQVVIPWLTPVAVVGVAVIAGMRIWQQPQDKVAWAALVFAVVVTGLLGVLRAPNIGVATVLVWAMVLGIGAASFQALRELQSKPEPEHAGD